MSMNIGDSEVLIRGEVKMDLTQDSSPILRYAMDHRESFNVWIIPAIFILLCSRSD